MRTKFFSESTVLWKVWQEYFGVLFGSQCICRHGMLQTSHFSSSSVVFLCALRVFVVWVSSSSLRLPLCQIFISFAVSVVELADGEKMRTQSITHSLTHPAYLMFRFGTSILSITVRVSLPCHHTSRAAHNLPAWNLLGTLVLSDEGGALALLSAGDELVRIIILLVSPDNWNWSMPTPINAAFSGT